MYITDNSVNNKAQVCHPKWTNWSERLNAFQVIFTQEDTEGNLITKLNTIDLDGNLQEILTLNELPFWEKGLQIDYFLMSPDDSKVFLFLVNQNFDKQVPKIETRFLCIRLVFLLIKHGQ